MNRTAAGLDLRHHRPAVLANRRLQRQLIDVRLHILFQLPTVAIQTLAKISLPVKQTDADQRNAESGCALNMVSRKDAEPAGINGKRFMQPEFRGKIGYRTRSHNSGVPGS